MVIWRPVRPGQVAYFFHDVIGEPVIGKEVLSRRTTSIKLGWRPLPATTLPSNGLSPRRVRRIYVRPALRCMERAGQHGVYFILKSMEQGPDLSLHGSPLCHRRSQLPHSSPPAQPLHTLLLLHPRRNAGTDGDARGLVLSLSDHYYLNAITSSRRSLDREKSSSTSATTPFWLSPIHRLCKRPRTASHPKLSASGSTTGRLYWAEVFQRERAAMNLRRFYAVSQIEYCRNFIFKRNFPHRSSNAAVNSACGA